MSAPVTLAADYYSGNRTAHASVRIYEIANGQRRTICEQDVSGKRDARAVAAQFNATPWNF